MAFYDIVGIGGNKAASHIIIMCHMSGIWFFFSLLTSCRWRALTVSLCSLNMRFGLAEELAA